MVSTQLVAVSGRPQAPAPSTRYTNADGTFNFDTLADERERHETEEAKSAVSSRWTKAAAANAVLSMDVPEALAEIAKVSGAGEDSKSVPEIKANLIGEITRALSSRFSTSYASTAGLTRRTRWKTNGTGLVIDVDADAGGEFEEQKDMSQQSTQSQVLEHDPRQPLTKELVKQIGRRVYTSIERCGLTTFMFVSSGISSFYPLRRGSWVAVVTKSRLHIGQGANPP
jgi:hypothetical protein